jgi:hypothetical protein
MERDLYVDRTIILKWTLRKYGVWTGFTCLRIWTSGGLL